MHALVRAALAVTALAALTQAARWTRAPDAAGAGSDAPAETTPLGSPCPPGTLPDQGVCIPVPRPLLPAPGGPQGGLTGDRILRRPERPADHMAYQWPVPLLAAGVITQQAGPSATTGRRGSTPEASGVAIEQAPGSEVHCVALQRQTGDAVVLFVGEQPGPTVVTKHATEEARQPRTYLIVHGGLERVEVHAGQQVPAGSVLGALGQEGGQGRLQLDVRQVRAGVDPDRLSPLQLVDSAYTVPTDPRNVLPLAE